MLARHAAVQNGLVNLPGGDWDTLTAPPGGEATLNGSVAIRPLLDPDQAGRPHERRLVIAAEDGTQLGDLGSAFEVPRATTAGSRTSASRSTSRTSRSPPGPATRLGSRSMERCSASGASESSVASFRLAGQG
jgi:hypothetical protein